MAAKIKQLKLAYPVFNMDRNFSASGPNDPNIQVYRVVQLTNSTAYTPGQQLLKADVEALCASDEWNVTIVSPVS
jgi:hypothetical protein